MVFLQVGIGRYGLRPAQPLPGVAARPLRAAQGDCGRTSAAFAGPWPLARNGNFVAVWHDRAGLLASPKGRVLSLWAFGRRPGWHVVCSLGGHDHNRTDTGRLGSRLQART